MPGNLRQRDKPPSLTVQITHAERQVLDHRRLAGFHASVLGRALSRQMAAPTMLLWGGGLGFAVGEITRRRASTPDKTQRPRGLDNDLFGGVLKALAFARTVSRLFPRADDPDIHHQNVLE